MAEYNPKSKRLLELINLGPVEIVKRWGYFISRDDGWFKRICLIETTWVNFTIGIHPGDDMAQAGMLFTKNALSVLQKRHLEGDGWKLHNKFHFSSAFGRNIFTTDGANDIGHSDYFRFWKEGLCAGSLHQYKRNDWKVMLDTLTKAGMMNDKDLDEFENEIASKNYTVINICPGISIEKHDSFDRLKSNTIEAMATEWREDLLYLISCFS